jgi:hypothetical protein
MGDLRKITFGESHMMRKEVFVTSVKLASTACTDK